MYIFTNIRAILIFTLRCIAGIGIWFRQYIVFRFLRQIGLLSVCVGFGILR